jgi:hypothetical protein
VGTARLAAMVDFQGTAGLPGAGMQDLAAMPGSAGAQDLAAMPCSAGAQDLQTLAGLPDVLDWQGVLDSWEHAGCHGPFMADLRGPVLQEYGCRCVQVLAFLTPDLADINVGTIVQLTVLDSGIIDGAVTAITIATGGAAAGTAAHTDMAIRDTDITLRNHM